MKITSVTVFPAKNAVKVKANGAVTIDDALELKFIVLDGDKGPYVLWQGGKKYQKKDGTDGWDSPIFIKDKAFNDTINQTVLAKLTSVSGGSSSRAAAPAYDASMSSDDIPF